MSEGSSAPGAIAQVALARGPEGARAGLLLCDELETALRMLEVMGRPWATSAAREDLERFWLSDELSTLRGALGW